MTRNTGRVTLGEGRYELMQIAGEGGMATVWKAIMRGAAGFSRFVAIKHILQKLHTNQEFVEMFVEESRVGSQLQHANIVQTYDFGQDPRGVYYLVLEWVEGLDFGRWLEAHQKAGKRPSWTLIIAVAVEALRGLGAAHDRIDGHGKQSPVIHRDLTPQNILISTNGLVKISDFGLSRAMDRLQMTHPDVIKGKLAFLAPEVTMGQPATVQSDLFSLGVVIWEALAERALYQGKTDAEVFLAAREAKIPPLSELRPSLPSTLVEVIHMALAREPAQRFATAREMQRALASQLKLVDEETDDLALGQSVIEAREALGMPEPRPVPPPDQV
jgi:serine/threonine-protein kinase